MKPSSGLWMAQHIDKVEDIEMEEKDFIDSMKLFYSKVPPAFHEIDI